jgi:hypothetical protein
LFNEFFRSLFIRADKAGKMSWALAPEGCFFESSLGLMSFSAVYKIHNAAPTTSRGK